MKKIGPRSVHSTLKKHVLVDGYPLVVDLERSYGSWMFDAKGEVPYLDFFSFFASNPLGFNHPSLKTEEMKERLLAVASVKVSNPDKYTTYYAEFVDTLATTAGSLEFPHYFFVEGGALAVENAMKTAFDWKVRKNLAAGRAAGGDKILHLERAFHGRSGYTLSVTNTDPNKTDYFPKFDWPRITSPYVDFGDPDGTLLREVKALREARAAFERDPYGIAAILLEPIQGEGGDNHFRREFFEGLRALADEFDALLIYDEVQTGIGGTGKWWQHRHHWVLPDIICFAKKMQVGGIMVSKKIDEVEDNVFQLPGRINSTWGGGLVDMVRATCILETISSEGLIKNAELQGWRLLAGLDALQQEFPRQVSNARGQGLMCAMDLSDASLRNNVVKTCFDNKMIILPCGRSSVRFRPNLAVTEECIAEGLKRLKNALVACIK